MPRVFATFINMNDVECAADRAFGNADALVVEVRGLEPVSGTRIVLITQPGNLLVLAAGITAQAMADHMVVRMCFHRLDCGVH